MQKCITESFKVILIVGGEANLTEETAELRLVKHPPDVLSQQLWISARDSEHQTSLPVVIGNAQDTADVVLNW